MFGSQRRLLISQVYRREFLQIFFFSNIFTNYFFRIKRGYLKINVQGYKRASSKRFLKFFYDFFFDLMILLQILNIFNNTNFDFKAII